MNAKVSSQMRTGGQSGMLLGDRAGAEAVAMNVLVSDVDSIALAKDIPDSHSQMRAGGHRGRLLGSLASAEAAAMDVLVSDVD